MLPCQCLVSGGGGKGGPHACPPSFPPSCTNSSKNGSSPLSHCLLVILLLLLLLMLALLLLYVPVLLLSVPLCVLLLMLHSSWCCITGSEASPDCVCLEMVLRCTSAWLHCSAELVLLLSAAGGIEPKRPSRQARGMMVSACAKHSLAAKPDSGGLEAAA